jgi:endo-1,4-beta-xylanase
MQRSMPRRPPRHRAGSSLPKSLSQQALRCALLLGTLLALTGLPACGGSDPTKPPTCADDPTLPGCGGNDTTPTPPSPDSTLASSAARRGRSFGVAVDALFTQVNPTYYGILGREFNMVVAGNFMKWSSIHRDGRYAYRFQWPDSMVAYAQAKGMKVRGHTLVWHNQNPTWLTNPTTPWNPDTLRQVLIEHIDTVVGHFKGKIYAWDVVNEALNDGSGSLRSTLWSDALGRGYIETAFRTAHAADPDALLFYNDYNLETPGAKQDSAFALLSSLKAAGVPVNGIGFQGHLLINSDGSGAPSKQTLVDTFNRFAALGLKIEVTELDVRIPDGSAANPTVLSAQNQAYQNIVGACMAVSACDALVVWGLTDAESWIPGTFPGWGHALLWDNAYNKKATYTAVKTAITSS